MQTFLDLVGARKGHFRYESGYHSYLSLNLDPLFTHIDRIQPYVQALADRLARYKIDSVCGPMLGGGFLALMVASILKVDFFYAERFAPAERKGLYPIQYRIPAGIQNELPGARIAIVDDVISAGSAVRSTFVNLRAAGAVPVVTGALLLLGTQAQVYFAEYQIPIEPVEQADSNLWEPDACPLCQRGVPIEDISPA